MFYPYRDDGGLHFLGRGRSENCYDLFAGIHSTRDERLNLHDRNLNNISIKPLT